MTLAPKCKVCGERHSGVEHVWPKLPELKVWQRATHPSIPITVTVKKPGEEAVTTAWTLEDYLRAERIRKAAYMRAYRAKRKLTDSPGSRLKK